MLSLQATVTEESKGFYKAAFIVKHTGVYEVLVSADGQPIKGVPFKCEVHPGKPDYSKCKLGGQGLQAVRLGQPCDVLVELYDIYSNRLTSALDALSDIQVCSCCLPLPRCFLMFFLPRVCSRCLWHGVGRLVTHK